MVLQASGSISLSDINVELGRSSAATVSLDDGEVRTLAGVATGSLSLSTLYGKTLFTISLFPDGGDAFGSANARNFTIECTGAPVGATYVWSFSNQIGGWTVTSGQNTDTVIIRGTGASTDQDIETDVTCTVTYGSVVRAVTAHWVYIVI